jgi:hypothetical protein
VFQAHVAFHYPFPVLTKGEGGREERERERERNTFLDHILTVDES